VIAAGLHTGYLAHHLRAILTCKSIMFTLITSLYRILICAGRHLYFRLTQASDSFGDDDSLFGR
jgi:hypothetical protein